LLLASPLKFSIRFAGLNLFSKPSVASGSIGCVGFVASDPEIKSPTEPAPPERGA